MVRRDRLAARGRETTPEPGAHEAYVDAAIPKAFPDWRTSAQSRSRALRLALPQFSSETALGGLAALRRQELNRRKKPFSILEVSGERAPQISIEPDENTPLSLVEG